jgi:hypothetical protein
MKGAYRVCRAKAKALFGFYRRGSDGRAGLSDLREAKMG